MLQQHAVDYAQVQLALAYQCFDHLLFQGRDLFLNVLKFLFCLPVGDTAGFFISRSGKRNQVFPRDRAYAGKKQSDLFFNRIIQDTSTINNWLIGDGL